MLHHYRQNRERMKLILINTILASIVLIRIYGQSDHHLPASISAMIKSAQNHIPDLDYESRALKLMDIFHKVHDREKLGNKTREGYLCTTYLKWNDASQRLLYQNMQHTENFCDWIIIVYNAMNHTEKQITEMIVGNLIIAKLQKTNNSGNFDEQHSTPTQLTSREPLLFPTSRLPSKHRRFQVHVLPSKSEIPKIEKQICEKFVQDFQQFATKPVTPLGEHPSMTTSSEHITTDAARESNDRIINENNLYESPCEFIQEDIFNDPTSLYNPYFYSKVGMLQYLLPYLSHYRHAWILDGDLSLIPLDMYWFARIHQCSLFDVPLVAQPLIHENTQFYRYTHRRSWTNSNILASTTGFIEIQAPLIDTLFLEWYIMAFVVPMSPALHILGVDWGFDELFCKSAGEFATRLHWYKQITDNFDQTNRSSTTQPLNTAHMDARHNVCALVISDMSINHRNLKEIVHLLGKDTKLQLNFGLMKLVHKWFGAFAQNGLMSKVDPLIQGNGYKQVRTFVPQCEIP